ncbi:hypothetical protein QYE76_002490 [Lolium multiflorum]|uniref:Uncharacterized protein n=1 Tax=Lolium multiflorum TaxID=4521 RepID=A0AAD8RML6_LOLMU|nr:hypothetical protein QYE76_002490 [Lolium multiflorum]
MIIAAKLGILWNGTKSPHPKSLPRFFTRVMCRQKDDSVGQLLKKLATAHVPNKDSERASDADIGRKEAGFGPIVLASNHLSGRLGSAHLDPPELNIKEKQVTAHVPAKQHCSTDVQSSSDANVCRNKTEGCGTGEAKIRRLQKDLDVATWRNKEMNRGWNSTIQDGLHAVADLQKLVAGNLVTALADADVHEINWTILEQLRFEFDEDQEEVKHVLNSLFSDCLRQYRSRLKKKYFTGKITGSVPTISPFKQMTDKQWGDLVKHWSDPKNMGALPPALDLDSFPCVEEAIRVADEFCDQYRALRREVEILQEENQRLRRMLEYYSNPSTRPSPPHSGNNESLQVLVQNCKIEKLKLKEILMKRERNSSPPSPKE